NDTATPLISTLSLHDALPIYRLGERLGLFAAVRDDHHRASGHLPEQNGIDRFRCKGQSRERNGRSRLRRSEALQRLLERGMPAQDRKSTRLNSSHRTISYAVF